MFLRNRFGTTAALVCHLLLAVPVVTSQLLPQDAPPPGAEPQAETLPSSPPRQGDEVTMRAAEQEKIGSLYKLRGNVEIEFRNLVLRGDEASYDSSGGEVAASGHLVLDGGPHDEHITASHGNYNIRTQTGKFYDVVGTSGIRVTGRMVTLTSSSPFVFSGRVVEKTGPDRYLVLHGMVTSCEMPKPKWTLNAERIAVDLGGKAKAYSSTFRIEKVPILYLPYADHPAEQLGRQTGFMIPSLGTSSIKGFIAGESFYWAISHSMDTMIGAEYFSKRGWSQQGTWRFRPSEDSYLTARYFGVLDRGYGSTHIDEGGEEVGLDGEAKFPHGFRGVLSANYLSSFVFRLAFGETFAQAVDSEVKSVAFLSKSTDGYSFNFLSARYQNFQSIQAGDVVTILHAPSFDINSVDRQLGRSPIYWSFDSALEGVSRKEPQFVTNDLVGRFDLHPRASLPLFLGGWSLRPEFGVRETYYTQRLQPAIAGGLGTPVQEDVNRRALEATLELRPPALARIFDRSVLRHKLKHVIEPRLVYRYVTGIDNFADIIRFDSRDILSDTNEIEYAVVQRLYVKRLEEPSCESSAAIRREPPRPGGTNVMQLPQISQGQRSAAASGCAPNVGRELVSWELKQKYFFDPYFGGALLKVNGVFVPVRNVLTTTDQFTGIAFLTGPRVFTPIVSRLLVHPSASTDLGWQLDYDTIESRVNASTVYANYRLGSFFLGGGHTYFLAPGEIFVSNPTPGPPKFNQFRLTIGYGNLSKRGVNAAANIGFDSNLRFLQYAAFQSSYNWDCCGLSFEYRRYALGIVRNENQYRFAFTLANIGTFGNLRRQERIY